MKHRTWLALLGLVACGDDAVTPSRGDELSRQEDTGTPAVDAGAQEVDANVRNMECDGTMPIPESDCASVPNDECGRHPECRIVSARPLVDTALCLGDRTILGCEPADTPPCGHVNWQTDATGQLHAFIDSCAPEGYTPAAEPAVWHARCDTRFCEFRSLADCATDTRCALVSGRLVDAAAQCVGESEPVGCQDAEKICPPVIAYAKTPGGQTVEIASGCVPQGFDATEAVDVRPEWSRCEAPLALPTCEDKSEGLCIFDSRCTLHEGACVAKSSLPAD